VLGRSIRVTGCWLVATILGAPLALLGETPRPQWLANAVAPTKLLSLLSSVGAKHDRSKFMLLNDNLYPVMLRPCFSYRLLTGYMIGGRCAGAKHSRNRLLIGCENSWRATCSTWGNPKTAVACECCRPYTRNPPAPAHQNQPL
jgi:hypothetical protein